MAAFALQPIAESRYYIRLDSSVTGRDTDHTFLLDASRLHTDSESAVIYRFYAESTEVNAAAARSSGVPRVKDVGVTLSAATSQWLGSLAAPAQGTPASDPNFEKFPEVFQYQLKRLIVVPLRTADDIFGLLTLGRLADSVFDQPALEVATGAARLFSAVLERDLLHQKLVERKLIERAKGILQQGRRLSEEQAYILLHNNSRRRKIPMVSLAKEVIDTHVQAVRARRWKTT